MKMQSGIVDFLNLHKNEQIKPFSFVGGFLFIDIGPLWSQVRVFPISAGFRLYP